MPRIEAKMSKTIVHRIGLKKDVHTETTVRQEGIEVDNQTLNHYISGAIVASASVFRESGIHISFKDGSVVGIYVKDGNLMVDLYPGI